MRRSRVEVPAKLSLCGGHKPRIPTEHGQDKERLHKLGFPQFISLADNNLTFLYKCEKQVQLWPIAARIEQQPWKYVYSFP